MSKIFLILPLLLMAVACTRDPKQVSKKYVETGNKYFDRGRFKQASIMYRTALNKDRLNGEAYYRLGLTNLKLGELANAVRVLRRAVELQPGNDDAISKLADIYLMAFLASPERPETFVTCAPVENPGAKMSYPTSRSFIRRACSCVTMPRSIAFCRIRSRFSPAPSSLISILTCPPS